MANYGIPITSLINIGSNISANTTFVAVDLPANTSNKVTLGNITDYLFSSNIDGSLGNLTINSVTFLDNTYQNTAWTGSIDVANVSNIGNISVIDLDGSASNILYGNGSFAAPPPTNLSGDGGNLSNIQGGNVSGEVGYAAVANSVSVSNVSGIGSVAVINTDGDPANVLLGNGTFGAVPGLGNVGELNLDGNASNILYGNGSFASAPSVSLTGDGGNISNIQGSNVSGAVAYASTANSVAVGNVSGIGNIATVNLTGSTSNVLYGNGTFAPPPNTALTGDGGNLSNIQGANVSGAVAYASTANSVAASNVSGLGNIATVNTDGNASNVLLGNGTFGTVPGLGNVGGTNFDGNSSNVLYGNGVFAAGGGGSGGSSISNGTSNVSIDTVNGNITISVGGEANIATFYNTGASQGLDFRRPLIEHPDYEYGTQIGQYGVVVSNAVIANSTSVAYAWLTPYGLDIWSNTANAPVVSTGQYNSTTGYLTVLGTINANGNVLANGNVVAGGYIKSGPVTYTNSTGSNGQVLVSDGAGGTYWATTGSGGAPLTATAIINGTSNVTIASANGNVSVGVAGNANVVKIDGSNVSIAANGFIYLRGSPISDEAITIGGKQNQFSTVTIGNVVAQNYSDLSVYQLYVSGSNGDCWASYGAFDLYVSNNLYGANWHYSVNSSQITQQNGNKTIQYSTSPYQGINMYDGDSSNYIQLTTNSGVDVYKDTDNTGYQLGAAYWYMYTNFNTVFEITSNATSNTAVANVVGTINANNINATNAFQLPVYADATARDAAIPTPTTGMMVFVTGSGMQVYGATQWNAVSGTAT